MRKGRLLAAAIVVSGCASDRPLQTDAVTVRDSAGAQIIENSAPAWDLGREWQIEPEPLVEIGSAEDLYQIRGAYRRSDGSVIVANAGSLELWVYDTAGRLVSRVGRRGSGPGEFLDFSRVRRSGDAVLVYDFSNGRVTTVSPDEQLETHRVPPLPNGSTALMEDVFADGSLLATPAGGPPAGSGRVRRTRSLYRVPLDGREAVFLAEFPELELQFFERMPRPIAFRQPFFGLNAFYATAGEYLIRGSNDRHEFLVHAPDGRLTRIIRLPEQARQYGAAEVAGLIDQTVAAYRNEAARPALRAVLQELPHSGAIPEWGWPDYRRALGQSIIADDEGNLWVAEYHMPNDDRSTRNVITSEGRWLGSVRIPDGLSPFHVGSNFIVGVWRDEFDVESVRIHRLHKAH